MNTRIVAVVLLLALLAVVPAPSAQTTLGDEYIVSATPDAPRGMFKTLSDDLGVSIYTDPNGTLHGRLFFRKDGSWVPVALDGFAEVGPLAVPARH
jgi:hypothetical protein